ncbi:BTAD domain-containing putative transcriptional regulator [Lentzea sp. NPDC060358]|uniref:AfsR/SARP family transcriptional regulator n=1 Tax=Lentzea sp. NPDC060358 TaxID=3347103 RepID=UPI00365DFC58
MPVELVVLGDVGVRVGDRRVDVGHLRQRCVFAVLAVEANRVVTVDRLLERAWPGDPPLRHRAVLRTYLSRLRSLLVPEGVQIQRRPTGYVLLADPGVVDLHRFRRLVAQAAPAGDEHALELLDQALRLWRGEPFAGLDTPWLAAVRTALERERAAARLDRVDVALRRGRHAEVLPGLVALAERDELDERVCGQLVLALHRAGRTADALARYRQLRARLVEQLGAEPCAALQELHQRVLAGDPGLAVRAGARGPVPRQLPAPPRWFTGRDAELARLDRALGTPAGTALVISSIGGSGGIGKTWLALAWAHRHVAEFPDGQLFADLHGFSPADEPVPAEAALRFFLESLGVEPDRVPADAGAMAALYRSLVADRRMLVLLDNAASAEQVVPLLPGSPSCTVVVTGRTKPASLIDRHGARHLTLDVLDRTQARALLAARLGTARVAAEPGAVDEVVDLCGGHPLALSITARNAAAQPAAPLAEVADELRVLGLEVLDHDDPASSLPAVLSWSLRLLTGEQRTVFGLLGLAPGPVVGVPAAAVLTGLPPARARAALRALEEASLLERRSGGRYAMHDLIRAFAATAQDLSDDERTAALTRVTDFYLHTAHSADRLLEPHRPLVRPGSPAAGVHPHPLPDALSATAWLEAEHPTLLAAQRAAASLGRHHVVWHLAWALDTFHYRRGHWRDELTTWQAALDATDHLPDPAMRSRAHRSLGYACSRLGLHERSVEHLELALDLALRHRDPAEQAHTHQVLAFVWDLRGDDPRTLHHARCAIELYRVLDNPVWEADALNVVGWCLARTGDLDAARDHCRAALGLHRSHDNAGGEADTLDSLGLIAHRSGEHRLALDHYDEALARYRAHGRLSAIASTLDNMAHPHVALGQRGRAREAWVEALELFRELGRDDDATRVRRELAALGPSSAEPPSG